VILGFLGRGLATLYARFARAHALVKAAIVIVLGAVLLWNAWAVFIVWTVDDSLPLAIPEARIQPGMSRSVAAAATLVEREARRWTPAAPWFMPASSLGRMPNFQLGIVFAVSQFVTALQERVARFRGSSAMDPDITQALGQLKYDPYAWLWGQGNIVPMSTASSQYLGGVRRLDAYNARLARKDQSTDFNDSGDALRDALDAIASDLGSMSAVLETRTIESNAAWFDGEGRHIFYQAKGRMYAYTAILEGLGVDYGKILALKQLEPQWKALIASMKIGAELAPFLPSNGPQDSSFIPSNLAAQGFYLLRARVKLREISSALQS